MSLLCVDVRWWLYLMFTFSERLVACRWPRAPVIALATSAVLLAQLLPVSFAQQVAEFRKGDVVPMSYRSQSHGRSGRSQGETPWKEALRSQMPRFGKPGIVHFEPVLQDGSSLPLSSGEDEDGMAVTFAFCHEQFVARRVTLTDGETGGGNKQRGPRLSRVVFTFSFAAGDIVGVRSVPTYDESGTDSGSNAAAAGAGGFDIEFRWERIPEEDGQAGIWLVFVTSLVLTMLLAVDACNTNTGDGSTGVDYDSGGGQGDGSRTGRSGSRGLDDGRAVRGWVGGGDVAQPVGIDELRRRR